MAAFETPWTTSMADPSPSTAGGSENVDSKTPQTTAAFSPHSNSTTPRQHRSTILLHQKSPLLLATPPQVTRALAYSHAFLIPLNKLAGLLSWTTGDPWESFLLVASFWFMVLYGDVIIRYAGPVILVVFLIAGMYFRRYSPLSSSGWTGEKTKSHKRSGSESPVEHRKSLDEILATLQAFTGRCNILLAPMMQMTDFLSTQQTATSATTRPALTTLFIRILFATPLWFVLTLPPLRIITAKRIVFAAGTLILSWHSRPARISRAILWRSRTVREAASLLTGLNFSPLSPTAPRSSPFPPSNLSAFHAAKSKSQTIRFTFSLYENQRRWIGLGWTPNMVAYERAPWTDEHLNPTPPPDRFILPDIEGGHAKWQWVAGSQWRVEPAPSQTGKDGAAAATASAKASSDEDAWIYYDNKWLSGARGQDGWGKYTRRRKWIRDAELVDIVPDSTGSAGGATELDPAPAPGNSRDGNPVKRAAPLDPSTSSPPPPPLPSRNRADAPSPGSSPPGSSGPVRPWFGHRRGESDAMSISEGGVRERLRRLSPSGRTGRVEDAIKGRLRGASTSSVLLASGVDGADDKKERRKKDRGGRDDALEHEKASSVLSRGSVGSADSASSRRDMGMDIWTPTERLKERHADWGLGEDVSMELG